MGLAVRKAQTHLMQKKANTSKDNTLKLDSSLFNQSFLMRKANSMKKQNQRIIQELVQARQYTTKVENMNHMFRRQQGDLLMKMVHSEEAAKRLLAENTSLKRMLERYGHSFNAQSLDVSDCLSNSEKNISLVGQDSLNRGKDDTLPSYVCMSVLDHTSSERQEESSNSKIRDYEHPQSPTPPQCVIDDDSRNTAVPEASDDSTMSDERHVETSSSEIKDSKLPQSPTPPQCVNDEDSHNTAINEASSDDSMMSLKLPGSSESSFLSNSSLVDNDSLHADKSKEETSTDVVMPKEQNEVAPCKKRKSNKRKKVNKNLTPSDSSTILPTDAQNKENIVSKPKRRKNTDKKLDESKYDLFSISKDSFIVDDDKRVKLPLAECNGEPRRAARSRKAVSYAEPSLSAKLRRGDKFTDGSIYKSFSPKKTKRKNVLTK